MHLVDVTAKRAELCPDRVAFVNAATGRQITYAELDSRVARLAGALQARGARAEDRVAIICRNRPEFFEALFACAKLGAILTPLNWRMPPHELMAIVRDCSPKLLLFGFEDADTARELARPGICAISIDDDYEVILRETRPLEGSRVWSGDAVWTLIYTSGTTGEPKGVIQTVQMAFVNYVHATQAFGVRACDRTLNFLPLFHTAGIHLLALPTLMAGGTVTVLPGFDAPRVMQLLPETDLFFAVPAVYRQLSLEPGFPLALRKIGSAGKPQLMLDLRIDVGGRDAKVGETGEIWMRGPGLTPGYWGRPEETAKAFTADGWLKSGDLGSRDDDGCIFIAGRIGEMYISGGENIFPAEVENVLARHPAVFEAAVTGVADEKWGEVGCAYVQLRKEVAPPSAADLDGFCRSRLASYKVPRTFVFVNDLPRTAAGKLRKHLLGRAEAASCGSTMPRLDALGRQIRRKRGGYD
ncbi:MAG: AMP-binding protein [Hyphomonadaceae bacterium]|nr:AMP-binding protein [Hyphomonadaceae bacterium]